MSVYFGLYRNRGVLSCVLFALACYGCAGSPEVRSKRHIDAGKEFLQKHDSTRALLEFRNAVRLTPKNAEAYFQIGRAFMTTGDLRSGLSSLRKALEIDPKHKAARLALAQLQSMAKDESVLRDAQATLEALLQAEPENATALHALGLTELKLGDLEDGMQHLERAFLSAPEELMPAITLAKAKSQQGDWKGAEAVLKKAIENSPKSAQPLVMLGGLYLSEQKPAEAEQQFQKALVLNPNHAGALLTLGTMQNALGRKPEAEQTFKRLAGLPGSAYKAIYGLYLFELGRQDEAIQEFERLVKEDPEDRMSRTRLIAAYQAAHKDAEAERVLAEALKRNPKDFDALTQRAELLIRAGKFGEAENDLNRVIQLNGNSAPARYVMAKFQQAKGSALTYRQELAKAVQLDPNLLAARLELIQVLLSTTNNPRAALDVLNETPASQKNRFSVLVARNWILWAMGSLPEMRKGIDAGLAVRRSGDLLVQDGLWKIQAGNPAGARASLEEALHLDPGNIRALAALNRSYEAQKQGALALQKVKEYAGRQPNSAGAQEFLGVLLMASGDREQARAAFALAKKADPKSLRADLSMVQIDAIEGRWNEAASKLADVLARNPGNAQARLWLGEVEVYKGNHGAALDNFQKAVDAAPDNAEALNNLAYLTAEYAKQPDLALKYAQRATELAPNDLDFVDTLGWILYQKGLYPLAIQHLERAAAKDANVASKYHLAMAYAKAGDPRARATLDAALRRDPKMPEAKLAVDLVGKAK